MKNYYDTLNLNKNATKQEIKAAYLKLAKKHHPDVNKSPSAKQKFQEIQDAYENLMNPNPKTTYQSSHNAQREEFQEPPSWLMSTILLIAVILLNFNKILHFVLSIKRLMK